MSPVTITSINQAFKEIKNLAPSLAASLWEGDYRITTRQFLKEIIENRMRNAIDEHLQRMAMSGIADRRNGSYPRHLLTELGDIELAIPRTRRYSPRGILKEFARRPEPVERTIMLAFVLGLSTRKIGPALLPILGEPVSPTTVSRIAQQLDEAVKAYQRRKLSDHYHVLILDGIVIKRKTGTGTQKRTVLVALGIRLDGKKEIIDFRQAPSERQSHWEAFLDNLYKRGLKGEHLQLIISDGGKGLLAALPFAYPQIPVQRCWAHKARNVLNYAKRADQKAMKRDLHRISHARNLRSAQQAAQRFLLRWECQYPQAAQCLKKDLPELLTFFQISVPLKATALRTTNAIERRFREVRRRTRPMGVFSDHTSVDRILFSVFAYENFKEEKTRTPFLLLTQLN